LSTGARQWPRRKKGSHQRSAASAASSGASSGRDARGRFARGNRIGHRFSPGNSGYPTKRWRHAALSLSQAGIHPEEVATLVRKLFDEAMGGDAKARQQFIELMLGKPRELPDLEAPSADESPELSGEASSKREYYRTHFKEFCIDLFPHLCTCQAWSTMHQEWFDLRLQHYGERGVQYAFAAPRGHAKTSILVTLATVHDIVYRLEQFILVVGSTAALATAKVRAIRDEIETNAKLRDIYGDLVGPVWNQGNFVCKNGVRVQAVSPGAQVRGILHQGQRVTKLVLDDAENALHVLTQGQRQKFQDWYEKDAAKLGVLGQLNVTVVGTVLHPESFLEMALNNPAFIGKRYQAVKAWNEQTALWSQWKDILSDLMNARRHADAFFQEHQDTMLEHAEVLWPARMPYVELMKSMLFEGRTAFQFEYQNNPIAGGSLFDMQGAGYFAVQPQGLHRADGRLVTHVQLWRWIAFYDPSTGAPDGDYGACVVVAEDQYGFQYVMDAYVGRDPSSAQVERVAELLYRWRIERLGLESNGFQSLLANNLREAFAAKALAENDREWSPALVEVMHTKAKHVRCATLESAITRKWLWFADSLPAEFMRQFREFVAVPDAGHDDAVDATEAAMKLLNPS
jgi:hypothetical protein